MQRSGEVKQPELQTLEPTSASRLHPLRQPRAADPPACHCATAATAGRTGPSLVRLVASSNFRIKVKVSDSATPRL